MNVVSIESFSAVDSLYKAVECIRLSVKTLGSGTNEVGLDHPDSGDDAL